MLLVIFAAPAGGSCNILEKERLRIFRSLLQFSGADRSYQSVKTQRLKVIDWAMLSMSKEFRSDRLALETF